MREIKFRGIDSNREWIYGSLIKVVPIKDYRDYKWEYGIHKPSIYDNTAHLNWNLDVNYVRTETVGQYTGLRDKNGREIYEGDIVRYYNDVEDELILGEVIYKADICSFRVKPKCLESTFLFAYWQYEVIGNIHDNPELLEEKR